MSGTGHERVRIDWLRRRLANGHSWWDHGRPAVALGCCEGENMRADTERIRTDSILAGAEQLRSVLQEVLDIT